MTAAKHTLHLKHLERFKEWVASTGGQWRPGKGEYQVIQVLTENGWAPVFRKDYMPEHYSVDPRLLPLVRQFLAAPVPLTPTGRTPSAPFMQPINMQTRTPPWESVVDADFSSLEHRVAATMLRPCRSPYCECPEGQCSHPGCYDARSQAQPGGSMPLTYPDFDQVNVNDPAALPADLVARFEQVLGPWMQAPGEFRACFIMGWYKKSENMGVAP